MVKIAVMGAGGIAAEHMKALKPHPKVEIVGICDVILENAQKMVNKNGGEPTPIMRKCWIGSSRTA